MWRILNIDENSLPEQIARKYRKNPPHAEIEKKILQKFLN
jgi:hypothetical protein